MSNSCTVEKLISLIIHILKAHGGFVKCPKSILIKNTSMPITVHRDLMANFWYDGRKSHVRLGISGKAQFLCLSHFTLPRYAFHKRGSVWQVPHQLFHIRMSLPASSSLKIGLFPVPAGRQRFCIPWRPAWWGTCQKC